MLSAHFFLVSYFICDLSWVTGWDGRILGARQESFPRHLPGKWPGHKESSHHSVPLPSPSTSSSSSPQCPSFLVGAGMAGDLQISPTSLPWLGIPLLQDLAPHPQLPVTLSGWTTHRVQDTAAGSVLKALQSGTYLNSSPKVRFRGVRGLGGRQEMPAGRLR